MARKSLKAPDTSSPVTEHVIRDLAQFRYALRRFLRFSESAARGYGVTPQQHQLMLGVAGFTGRSSATVSELAEFLQEKNHSVVGLVERAVESGLVRRTQDSADRRVVVITLTRRGQAKLAHLSRLHQEEIARIPQIWRSPRTKPSPEQPKNSHATHTQPARTKASSTRRLPPSSSK
jgi:DNA-binding MarR family transcriptional regulator